MDSYPANRQQRRKAAKGLGKGLGELMKNTQAQMDSALGKEPEEDLNILPFPESQEISEDKWIQWRWKPCNFVNVYGILFLKTQEIAVSQGKISVSKGHYEVQLSINDAEDVVGGIQYYSTEESKAIGQALVSASNWVNIWKEHAGMFLERELLGKPSIEIIEKDDDG